MKITGIIAEYNPFHNGHKYHLDQARTMTGADAVVAVISGTVTQRGEFARWNKWSRARMAVENGVDLVLELPYAFAVNSAEEFARGGVSILKSLGCVTDLVFGCESDPDAMISMARRSAECEEDFQEAIRTGLEEGLSYPQARGKAMMQFWGTDSKGVDQQQSLDQPNDILAVEYVRQLVLQGSDMVPHGVTRLGSYHDHQVQKIFSSATAVRKAIKEERWEDVERAVPKETLIVLREDQSENEMDPVRLDSIILSRLLMLGPEGIRTMYGCSEGLEYRIWNSLPKARSVDELLELTASGRYPTARIRRLLMHCLMGLTGAVFEKLKTNANEGKLFVRVLGCNETGAKLLKQIKKSEQAPVVITNLNKERKELKELEEGNLSLAMDLRAAEIAALGRGERLYDNSDFVKRPYIAHKTEKNHK